MEMHANAKEERFSLGYIVREGIHKKYKFEKTLGEGSFGKVKVASLWSDPSKKFAIKSIPREFFDKQGTLTEEEREDEMKMKELLETEITVVLAMDHPNIVKFY